MEDSFSVRLDKVFGSLPLAAGGASSSSSTNASLWRLTDEEVEKREWNRNKGSPEDDDEESKPYPSNLDGFFSKRPAASEIKSADLIKELKDDLDEDDEEDEEEEDEEEKRLSRNFGRPDGFDDEAWDIRSSIGLDCTLDKEEEEDEYDKVATGREEAVESLYTRDVTDYETDMSSYNGLRNKIRVVNKDPRANHIAAKIRLKEDAEAAKDLNHVQAFYNNVDPALDSQNDISKDGVSLNSILKNREKQTDSKSKKRVRFDSSCKDGSDEVSEGTNTLAMKTSSMEEVQATSSGVPDYVRNPSKYKHYTFDSSTEIDEASNRRAYEDFLKLQKGPDPMESQDDVSFELPKSVTFTPKKKLGDKTLAINRSELKQTQEDKKGYPIGIAAVDEEEESEICAMEEDEVQPAGDRISNSQRAGRRYRTKGSVDLD